MKSQLWIIRAGIGIPSGAMQSSQKYSPVNAQTLQKITIQDQIYTDQSVKHLWSFSLHLWHRPFKLLICSKGTFNNVNKLEQQMIKNHKYDNSTSQLNVDICYLVSTVMIMVLTFSLQNIYTRIGPLNWLFLYCSQEFQVFCLTVLSRFI